MTAARAGASGAGWLSMASTLLVALALLSGLGPAQGKIVSGKGYFGTHQITEVTKFSFRPGSSKVVGNVTYTGEPRGSVYMFMDTNWHDKFHNEPDCEKVKHAHTRIPIGRVGKVGHGIGVARAHAPEPVSPNSEKVNWQFTWTIKHEVRTYGWYIVIADCRGFENGDDRVEDDEEARDLASGSKKRRRRRLKKNLFRYTFELYNPDGDHLPADERGLPTLYLLTTAAMGGYLWYSSSAYQRKTGHGMVVGPSHAVIKGLAFAYVFQIISMVLEIIHLFSYSYNGHGVFVFDLMSESTEALSQLIMSFLLLCLGNGWTLVDFSRRPPGKGNSWLKQLLNRPQLDDETPTLFVLIVIVFISTILQIINKVKDDDFLKFHDYDGLAGKFLLLQRLVLGIAFTLSIVNTIQSEEARGQIQLQGFLRSLAVFGAVWFFVFPVLVFVASIFAHYLRHRIVTGGVLIIQATTLTLMTQQFLGNSSWYARVSEVASSGMLPGAFGGGPAKAGKMF
ncbi:Integral membrane protein GPR180 [Hondaea fermentalgiana]|uniref:Integral membrane protein GPR180 n=1 Tax=Hondaea fermentalgiana TaxID=2315210 RepID=A0A2R5GB63_9STRA|nr:Integral membrane protein GPR180 [Hondaea fermentalgiana]|eukprot:GBG28242.1 Integral membrane protein GPR180 [Hondaea fermentalgiana]